MLYKMQDKNYCSVLVLQNDVMVFLQNRTKVKNGVSAIRRQEGIVISEFLVNNVVDFLAC